MIKPIRIITFKDPAKVGACHLLYINLEKKADIAACLKRLPNRAILTVGDHPAFLDAGGMIRFQLVNLPDDKQKVRWAVNAAPASTAGINLGSAIQQFAMNARDNR